jgi:general secretion pathway protein F
MAVFEYTGLVVASGKQVKGVRDADNAKALRAMLKREGILITSAQEETKAKKSKAGNIDFGAFLRRSNLADISMMTRQLATLVGAGIPLVEAVSALTEQVEKDDLKRTLTQVRDRLNEGSSLAKAMEAHPKIFTNLYVSMVAAGEASGTLEVVLERLSDFQESQAKLRGKVGAALMYPLLMMIIGGLLLSIMIVVVVPKVTSIFASLDRALPWYTQALIGFSDFLASNAMLGFLSSIITVVVVRRALAEPPPGAERNAALSLGAWASGGLFLLFGFTVGSLSTYLLGAGAGLVAGFFAAQFVNFLATPAGRLWKDSMLLRLPIFGSLFRMLAVSRFSRTLATLLKSGVPLLKAMDIVKNVLDNAKLEKVIEEAAGSIREGESIALPLKRSGAFPPIVTHMIAVGEKSGQLEQMLENVSRAYDAQVETRVQGLTSLLEPLIMVMMGGAVGFVAFAILMPLVQMNEFAQ